MAVDHTENSINFESDCGREDALIGCFSLRECAAECLD